MDHRPASFLAIQAARAEAIVRSGLRGLLASGALSHRFKQIDRVPKNPRIFHESNVFSLPCIERDKKAIALLVAGAMVGHAPTDPDEVRRVALGVDGRVPAPCKEAYRRGAGKGES